MRTAGWAALVAMIGACAAGVGDGSDARGTTGEPAGPGGAAEPGTEDTPPEGLPFAGQGGVAPDSDGVDDPVDPGGSATGDGSAGTNGAFPEMAADGASADDAPPAEASPSAAPSSAPAMAPPPLFPPPSTPADRIPSPDNPAECPDVAPADPWGPCAGLPVYLNCDYGTYHCVCDWIHWICAG